MNRWMSVKTEARSIARRLGLTRLIQRAQFKLHGEDGYEPKVVADLQKAVRERDVVWDVGANVGQFTCLFSDWVGPRGEVVAFEPAPSVFAALRERTHERANVRLLNVGLSDVQATLPMHLAEDPEGTINTFLATRDDTPRTVELTVHPGDALRRAEHLPIPAVVKVDVEGLELEVLRGLDHTLREPACRHVLCEVHFALLESRGHKHAPAEIYSFLSERGFSLRWITPSHLAASRQSGG